LANVNRFLQKRLQDIQNHEENRGHLESLEENIPHSIQREAIHGRVATGILLDHPIETPFFDAIMTTEFPNRVKSRIELFDEHRDPQEHLDAYKSAMISFRANEAAMCRCFPSTLKKDTNKWFLRLPPRSVNSYRQLTELFLAQFAYKVARKKSQEDLGNIRQGENESLKCYLNRFDKEALMVNDVHQEVLKTLLISGLQAKLLLLAYKEKKTCRSCPIP
jgi:hypothetical protein